MPLSINIVVVEEPLHPSPPSFPCNDELSTTNHLGEMDTDLGKEGEGATMTVRKPDYHERGIVAATTTERKSKYSKKSTANSSARSVSTKKHIIATGKQVYIERHALKCHFDVSLDAYEIKHFCMASPIVGMEEILAC